MIRQEQKETRKKMIDDLEQKLFSGRKPEDSLFYHHSSEDRVVLSHALFWVMTQFYKGRLKKEKFFLLLRQYEEEMLSAYLTEDEYFPELLHSCNVLYEALPTILSGAYNLRTDKDSRKLAAIAMVAAGYGGDVKEELCYDMLDDMDFFYNKVKCRKIEQMLPQLNKMVENEVNSF